LSYIQGIGSERSERKLIPVSWNGFLRTAIKLKIMSNVSHHFPETATLREKILYILTVLHKASADEVAMELMEMQGIASEEGVANLTIDVEEEIQKLQEEGRIVTVKEHRQKKRFSLPSI
jgi:hypothetical protein